jgi:hypothetical protein
VFENPYFKGGEEKKRKEKLVLEHQALKQHENNHTAPFRKPQMWTDWGCHRK